MAKSELEIAEEAARAIWEDGLPVRERAKPSDLRPSLAETIKSIREGLSDLALRQRLANLQSKIYGRVQASACSDLAKALKELVGRNA